MLDFFCHFFRKTDKIHLKNFFLSFLTKSQDGLIIISILLEIVF